LRGSAEEGVDVRIGAAAVGIEVICSAFGVQPASKKPIRMECNNFTRFSLFRSVPNAENYKIFSWGIEMFSPKINIDPPHQ
jgi:hypothetical protein